MPDRDKSPYADLMQFRVVVWREGYAQVACEVTPAVMNRNGIVHGGVMLALLDEAAGTAGVWCPVPGNERRSVTVDLNCRFVAPGRAGRILAEAHVVSSGRSIFFCKSEVRDAAGTLLAFGSSTHRFRSGSDKLEGVPIGQTGTLRS